MILTFKSDDLEPVSPIKKHTSNSHKDELLLRSSYEDNEDDLQSMLKEFESLDFENDNPSSRTYTSTYHSRKNLQQEEKALEDALPISAVSNAIVLPVILPRPPKKVLSNFESRRSFHRKRIVAKP